MKTFSVAEIFRQARAEHNISGDDLCQRLVNDRSIDPELDLAAYALLYLAYTGRRPSAIPTDGRKCAQLIAHVANTAGHGSIEQACDKIRLYLDNGSGRAA